MRFGLCCIFCAQPIKFRTTTARALLALGPGARSDRLVELGWLNAEALRLAVDYCGRHGIGAFRINSQILPLTTHPELGYRLAELPGGEQVVAAFRAAGERARQAGVRLTMHPDQFVVLSSPHPEVVGSSLAEIEYQAEFADWTGVDVINVHGGGAYGDKAAALERFACSYDRLSEAARRRLTVENDDRTYTPADLLPLCRRLGMPLVYDVHHHRCRPDGLTVAEATAAALATWDREPLFHVSSPRDGWGGPHPERHHDYLDAADLPVAWRDLEITVEVEAKAKELALARLIDR